MTTMMHLANYMMQKEFLMRFLNRLDLTLKKSVKLPLKNTMLAKVLGPISGKTSMLLFVESCSNMALFL